jgi:hypothetical protein
MALTDKLTAIADAIRGKTGKTDGLTLDQMAAEIAGIEAGGGGGAELVFETEFNLAEVPSSKTTVATITTGLHIEVNGRYVIVFECIRKTSANGTNHFKARTETIKVDSTYVTANQNGGWIISDKYYQVGGTIGVFASACGKYLATITVQASPGSENYGLTQTGDYSIRVYKQTLDIYGLEE